MPIFEDKKWFDIWSADAESVIKTMIGNMIDDLKAGYDFCGASITKQLAEIDKKRKSYKDTLMSFVKMDSASINRWCYFDLLSRGVITAES